MTIRLNKTMKVSGFFRAIPLLLALSSLNSMSSMAANCPSGTAPTVELDIEDTNDNTRKCAKGETLKLVTNDLISSPSAKISASLSCSSWATEGGPTWTGVTAAKGTTVVTKSFLIGSHNFSAKTDDETSASGTVAVYADPKSSFSFSVDDSPGKDIVTALDGLTSLLGPADSKVTAGGKIDVKYNLVGKKNSPDLGNKWVVESSLSLSVIAFEAKSPPVVVGPITFEIFCKVDALTFSATGNYTRDPSADSAESGSIEVKGETAVKAGGRCKAGSDKICSINLEVYGETTMGLSGEIQVEEQKVLFDADYEIGKVTGSVELYGKVIGFKCALAKFEHTFTDGITDNINPYTLKEMTVP